MKKFKGVVWGILLVAIGALWCLDIVGILNFTLFFDGWWTLIIIVPSFIDLITEKNKTGSIIGLAIGVLLLLACQNIAWSIYRPFLMKHGRMLHLSLFIG